MAAGLDVDEAFLVALKRGAEDDDACRGFARAFSTELWTTPGSADTHGQPADRGFRREFLVMLACAVGAAAAIKVPALFGYGFDDSGAELYPVNLSFFVLPFLAAYLAWVRRPPRRQLMFVAGVFVIAAVIANVYPFVSEGSTQILTAIHLPVLLWLMLGVVSAAGTWYAVPSRMGYTRFTGEWLITYALIALGGGVLSAITAGVFNAIGLQAEQFVSEWLIPCGAAGAVLVAAWLVDARASLVGGFAPMLARVFTPLFAIMLVVLVVAVVWTRGFVDVEREVLILFDVLLAVVVALLLYAMSARDPETGPALFDHIQLLLVCAALVVDLFALTSIAVRLGQFGFSANKTAALGLNVILLVNLGWSAYLQAGFLMSRRGFEETERWQMRYLPVYALWAAIVVVVFPLLFGFK
jgi:hypothetical protein